VLGVCLAADESDPGLGHTGIYLAGISGVADGRHNDFLSRLAGTDLSPQVSSVAALLGEPW
jgi:hypothetical protein